MWYMLVLATIMALSEEQPPQQVAFIGIVGGKQHIYVINLDGSGLKQLTTSPAEDRYPAWSPDGTTILFTRTPGHTEGEARSDGHLWTVKRNGTQLTQLTSGPVYDSGSWSPDGKRVTFYRQGPKPGSYVIDLVTRKVTKPSLETWSAGRSPDGKWFAYIRSETDEEDDHRADIWLTNSPGQKGQRLTNFQTSFSEPQWSPDGDDIVFTMERPSGKDSGDALCIMPIASRKIRILAEGRNTLFEDPRWSPDGKRICFLEANAGEEPLTNASFRQLYVISPDGKGKSRLTDHWGSDYRPQWTRDGKFIVIQGERGSRRVALGVTGESSTHIIVVDSTGRGERILPTGLPSYSPALSP